ncbi:hypothetical protein CGCSCA4_v008252 [Colletotrichum siamense]|uniref:Uncharacterized protein n=2 Tax=Colletotrichum gloeosporioides species complex TaxID=2707338 RepID=A0A9P5EBS5_COLSI|nr:uncharacterized protein COL26b_003667 [Colletotrichum chrysophilum]KAF4841832.1 hypothetical protein CGCSCA2_v014722 [Colletotrichum siamense]KAI8150979.1 hypothetical protein K4K50_011399 [Colletotrichum sp. SAR 10_71]KAI8151481.1 hypothetical protein K4K49_011385 [Colletotrichum sp. SAR 10_70]KAI8221300.1 hypothetical protein K4K53_007498 [Colletotrichum sp. SAR 10_77]KAI8252933.1 hypothetical protein K4K58_007561 [Colletotrichum sp. SAR11_239]KAI8286473.1 hypothetical protein K4K59_0070
MAQQQHTPLLCLWQRENSHLGQKVLDLLPRADVASLRLASSACCNIATKPLFCRVRVTFTANTFTKPSRLQALARVGHHIEHLHFHFAHTDATFLPPLIHPATGREISFLYTPHTSMASVLARPKYANTELGEILTQQYPPLFHAATNVPSFINAMKHFSNLRHLTIRCPGQGPQERYRRDIVDYALMSLRIAVERAPLEKLIKLSLSGMHPSAFNYLRHVPGFGAVPSAGRRWKQIRKLSISVEAWDFYGPSPGLDHLKIIDDYIRGFSGTLEKLNFTWLGPKGPNPIALSADPLFAPPRNCKKLFAEVTSPMSPLPPAPARKPMHFPRLRYMQVRNATMTAPQLADLVDAHQKTVKEFDFDNVVLINGGSWDEALAPLMEPVSSKSDLWSQHSHSRNNSEAGSLHSEPSHEDFDLPSPSAAAAAATRELLDFDLGSELLYVNDEDDHYDLYDGLDERLDEDLDPDVAAAKEASTSFSTILKKKRVHRRRKHRKDDGGREKEASSSKHHRSRSQSRHRKHKHHRQPPPVPEEDDVFRPSTPVPIISAPIQDTSSHPVLLQPAVYDPNASRLSDPEDCISSVQRNIEQEEAHRVLAEDAAARVSALRKAKAAVLMKLSKEFRSKTPGPPKDCSMQTRLREGFFGRSFVSVLPDDRAMSSQSALVPLMFTRS